MTIGKPPLDLGDGFHVFNVNAKGSVMAVVIRRITKYVVSGNEYNTEEKAVSAVEGMIEKIMRDILYQYAPLNPGDHIKIMDAILNRRTELAELLSYSFTDESDGY